MVDDVELLRRLERSLWDPITRYDGAHMEAVLAPDFVEFGRSGRVYDRAAVLDVASRDFTAVLSDIAVRLIGDDAALVTYRSELRMEGRVERGNRSSLWRRDGTTWLLEFHQGTPLA